MRHNKLDLRWCKHLQGQEAKEFELFVRSSSTVLERLSDIIKDIEGADAPNKKIDYNNPSWAYRQADNNGFARALKTIKDLIGDDKNG